MNSDVDHFFDFFFFSFRPAPDVDFLSVVFDVAELLTVVLRPDDLASALCDDLPLDFTDAADERFDVVLDVFEGAVVFFCLPLAAVFFAADCCCLADCLPGFNFLSSAALFATHPTIN